MGFSALIEALLLARLLKSEDSLPETLVRSAAFLFGHEEAQTLGFGVCGSAGLRATAKGYSLGK